MRFFCFFFLCWYQNKNNIFSAWNGDGQTSTGGGSLSWQPAGFKKAAHQHFTDDKSWIFEIGMIAWNTCLNKDFVLICHYSSFLVDFRRIKCRFIRRKSVKRQNQQSNIHRVLQGGPCLSTYLEAAVRL